MIKKGGPFVQFPAQEETAAEKAARLSPLETAILDMAITAAFMRPDSHIYLVDTGQHIVDASVFERHPDRVRNVVARLWA